MRLYPEYKSRLYCVVQVWPTHAALIEHLNANHHTIHGNGFGKRTQGACARHVVTSYPKGKRSRKSPCFAVINLHRAKLGIGVITHEIMHATLAWANRIGFAFAKLENFDVTMLEERICYAHSNMCLDFMHKGMRPGGIYTERDTVQAK